MSILIEDRIKDAILAVRWKRAGDGLHPDYFVGVAPASLQLEDSAASFLARFIAERVIASKATVRPDPPREGLEKYSVDVIVDYLEDQGYMVSSPD